jgi:hypothetical protein
LGLPKYTPLDAIVATCEQLYKANGFVKWSDVGTVHGLSRQAVLQRLQAATERGELNASTLDLWRSTSARAAQARNNRAIKEENERLRLAMTLTPDNKRWLDTECVARQCRPADIINGLINKARKN